MTNKDDETSARQARGWGLPLALATLGALGWACQDLADETESDGGSSGETNDTSDAGNGPGSGTDTGIPSDEVEPGDVLWSIGHQVVVPHTAEFVTLASQLDEATGAWSAALQADPAAEVELTAAQEAWRQAMGTWQALEVMQIGPAAPSVSAPGGQNIRDEIYSWPTVDTCSIDRAIADEGYVADDFFVTELVYSYGLDALEYLLFVHDMDHTCGTQVQLDGPWMALGFEEVQRRRAAYAAIVTAEIARQAQALAAAWSSDGADFAGALANPGSSDSPYGDQTEALNDVFRAMFYVDLLTKDKKLGRALGVVDGCTAPPCAELMESPYAGVAAASIAANLRGLRQMVQGGPSEDASGFDDLLIGSGNEDIATTLLADIDAAIAVAESFEDPLQQVIFTDVAQVEALHAAVKKVTDTLKGPFVMALMLTVPAEGAGDVD